MSKTPVWDTIVTLLTQLMPPFLKKQNNPVSSGVGAPLDPGGRISAERGGTDGASPRGASSRRCVCQTAAACCWLWRRVSAGSLTRSVSLLRLSASGLRSDRKPSRRRGVSLVKPLRCVISAPTPATRRWHQGGQKSPLCNLTV